MNTAAENNMPAVAITDHGVMYGVVDFYKAARDKGIRPILGCETYVALGSRFERKSEGQGQSLHHLTLLVADNTGYQNLTKLISSAHLEGFYYKPRIDKDILAAHGKGIIGLSGCLKGEVSACLLAGNLDGAIKAAGTYADILGRDNFFIEVNDHNLPEQRQVNRLMNELSHKTGLPLVATNDVHYLKKEHASAHEVLLCMQTQTVMTDPKRMRYRTEEFYMKNREEMAPLFAEFPGALDRTLEIAERCNVEIEFGKPHFPVFKAPDGKTQKEYLLELGLNGLKNRYGIHDPAHPKDKAEQEITDRFNMEVGVIEKTGYINYFLVVWDFVAFARKSGIPVGPGRGSGGGSLTAYVLGITNIDPIRYGLVFERFLNLERVSPPDFDIDFCQARRSEVIDYVKQKYGQENVAQIITFGSLGAKLVIRDVGRALSIPYAECDRLAKMVPDDPKITLAQALELNPELKNAYETDDNCKRILGYGFVLEGLYRNPSTHAAGVVISEKPLVEIVPLSRDKDKQIITQYSMEPINDLGLLKMDFLGLKTLTVIRETVELVRESHGVTLSVDDPPMDDKATRDLLNRGDTIGVFQLESAGMRDLLRRVGINTIEDLIAMIALYRPGPMHMLDDYVNRKTGKAEVKVDHDLLKPILKETYGVMIFQEQVQKAAKVLAGYSLGEGDILRRAMAKKKPEVMEQQRAKFVEGCRTVNHIKSGLAGRIFDTIAKFAGYGFPKAHSAGYAIIAYQTAYLKANYPAEFMSALLSGEIGNSDKLPVFINEAESMGLEMLPPDVNASRTRFMPSGKGIRFGLAGIKNVGTGAAGAVVAERAANGTYTDLINFCSRIDTQVANKKVLESLARCGAFDSFNAHRARLFNGIDFAMARAAQAMRDRQSGQGSLFDLMEEAPEDTAGREIPDCAQWHESELLAGEKELLGVYLSGHPLSRYAALLKRYQLADVKALADLADKTTTRLGGIVSHITRKTAKTTREPWAILQLEDLDGYVEVLVFPEVFQKYNANIREDAPVLVCGEVSQRDERPKIVAYEIYPLSDAPKRFSTRVGVHIPTTGAGKNKMEKVRSILLSHPGEVHVVICLQAPSGEKLFLDPDAALRVLPSEDLIRELEQELGEKSVYVAVDKTPPKRPASRRGA